MISHSKFLVMGHYFMWHYPCWNKIHDLSGRIGWWDLNSYSDFFFCKQNHCFFSMWVDWLKCGVYFSEIHESKVRGVSEHNVIGQECMSTAPIFWTIAYTCCLSRTWHNQSSATLTDCLPEFCGIFKYNFKRKQNHI